MRRRVKRVLRLESLADAGFCDLTSLLFDGPVQELVSQFGMQDARIPALPIEDGPLVIGERTCGLFVA
jgi:hypothetical protein